MLSQHKGLPRELHQKYGFQCTALGGNIYTVKQLLQLAKEVSGARVPEDYILESEGKFYDGLRPSVEPEGFQKKSDVIEQRKIHIKKVKWVFQNMDLFIFTLGLTEMWVARESGTVFPTAPGTVKGKFDKRKYKFKNSHYKQILNAFNAFQKEVRNIRDGRKFNVLLTVSPVPLTATASAKHALVATTHSKSILRAVAGKLADNQDHIDYFPSYEIATNPRLHSTAFSENLRTIRGEAVKNVMNHFFNVYDKEPFQIKHSHEKLANSRTERIDDTLVQCEEQLLEAFGN